MTLSRRDQKLEQVAQKIVPQSKLLRAWPLAGGISAQMTALEIQGPDGKTARMVLRRPGDEDLKQNPDAAEREFRLLGLLQAAGLAAPRPLHLDQSGEILPGPYLVIDYIGGELYLAPADPAACVLQLATHLAAIHRLDGSDPDLSFLPQRTGGCPEMLRQGRAEVDGSMYEGHIREALACAWPLPRRNRLVLLHGDYWPGNVLWRDGRLAAVIDWEDAGRGDPLVDLGNSRLEMAWILGLGAMESFSQHYRALTDIDYTDLPYWDLCAALRLIRLADGDLAGLAAFFAPHGRSDITEQSIREDYGIFVNQALEKLALR